MSNWTSIAAIVLTLLGTLLIGLGAFMSFSDWNRKNNAGLRGQADSFTPAGLEKLAIALRDYPPGQQMIVWGILVLILAGLFGGIAGLRSA